MLLQGTGLVVADEDTFEGDLSPAETFLGSGAVRDEFEMGPEKVRSHAQPFRPVWKRCFVTCSAWLLHATAFEPSRSVACVHAADVRCMLLKPAPVLVTPYLWQCGLGMSWGCCCVCALLQMAMGMDEETTERGEGEEGAANKHPETDAFEYVQCHMLRTNLSEGHVFLSETAAAQSIHLTFHACCSHSFTANDLQRQVLKETIHKYKQQQDNPFRQRCSHASRLALLSLSLSSSLSLLPGDGEEDEGEEDSGGAVSGGAPALRLEAPDEQASVLDVAMSVFSTRTLNRTAGKETRQWRGM